MIKFNNTKDLADFILGKVLVNEFGDRFKILNIINYSTELINIEVFYLEESTNEKAYFYLTNYNKGFFKLEYNFDEQLDTL